ncbi:protocadherin Fat 4-like [Physella acuta]|uniref:protocadherin Fat 4-like n=1 Tax=Physella acuta TaxID=109671 RepID=UPI0027DCF7D1|nr:protocadherin Fat 4-like [Physella acuta]
MTALEKMYSLKSLIFAIILVYTPAAESGVPVCSPSVGFSSVAESSTNGQSVYQLTCTDPDPTHTTLNYAFNTTDGGNTAGYFAVDPATGQITVASSTLDAENIISGNYSTPYILVISVDDLNSNVTYVTVVVSVTSTNDNSPTITGLSSPVPLPEDTALGTVVATCTLADLDLPGSGDELTSVKISSGDGGKFKMDEPNCAIILVDSLDYDTTPTYTLTVEAYNTGDTSKTATQNVIINVGEVNEFFPDCQVDTLVAYFKEDAQLNDLLATLTCNDKDSSGNILTYTTADTNFNVDSTGKITLKALQDYESSTKSLSSTILVSDSGSPSRTTTVTTSFFILDVDDEKPVFSAASYPISIDETLAIGSSVIQVTATDADAPNSDNSKITFAATCTPDWVKIDKYTGLVVVSKTMSYTTAPTVTCTLTAHSSTLTASTSTSTLTINLRDVNDGPPAFNQSIYTGSILEETATGTSVLQVFASDTDTPVTFYMTTGDPFIINPTTGVVSVNKKIDYDLATTDWSYLRDVTAVDNGYPAKTSTTFVNIKILPVNEFTPTFASNPTESVSENSTPGTSVIKVTATDGDRGNDGVLSYSLQDSTVPFVIESTTGIMRVGIGLDADVKDYYTVIVLAEDQSDTTKRTGSCTVTINVKDENDNQPVCDPIAPFLITPSTNVTNFLWQFSCSDKDVSVNGLQYTLVSGDTYNLFEVDSTKGWVRLRSSGPFQAGDYTLVFTVSDGLSPARTTTIAVKVKISQTLVFTGLPKVVQVYENTNVSEIIMTASASGTYELISYSIQSGDLLYFNIHQTQGTIRLVKSLDRETSPTSYTLVLKASTALGLVTSGTVTISVLDCNDNAPKFGNSYYNGAIFEGPDGLATTYTITATDPDSGNNATIDYSILSGNTGNVFKYSNTGVLSLASVLDYETTQFYTLVLCATDRGTPNKLSSTTLVFIRVDDKNEQNPILISPGGTVNITLPEDTATGANVFNITASDKDFGTQLTYYITSQSNTDQFSVNERLGGIYLNYPMDRESYQSLTLVVKVNNTNNQTNTTTIGITVSDVNDNDPVFSPAMYAVNTKHGTASGASIATLTVTDTDNGANSTMTLNITSGNTNNAFKFVGKVLTSNILLDANTNSLYILEVMAADHGTPPRYSTALVTVTIDPEFKQPLFNPTSDSISVLETKTAGDLIYNMDATANGAKEHASGDLLYSIKSGNSQNKFYIEPLGGELQLIEPLSYANTSSYTLVVLAQNILNNSLTSTFTLNITVTQVNLYDPVFSNTIYSWSVNETAKTGTIVGQVTATDKDVGQFGKLTYSMESGAPFTINSTTGVISLTGSLEYSTAKSYNFYVKAVDNAGASSRSSTSVVVISVTDFNNNSPVFTSSVYNVGVPETFPLAETFFYVLATDLDSGTFGEVTYAITNNSFGIFQIAKSTGELSLNKSLDYESNRTHVIIVTASDGSNTASATATVTVKDENDNTPNLGFTRVDLEIFSNIVVGTLLYDVNTTDRDVGVNGDLNYIIQSGNDDGLFNVDISNGKVKTTKSFESTSGFYTLVIAAIDQGIPPLSGTATIGITVNPVSQAPSGDYSFSVKENQPIGTVVDTIPPERNWTGDIFTIIGGNFNQTFSLTTGGMLTTNKVLDRETYAYYVLLVSVQRYDNTYVTKQVIVKVEDVNDNYPTFNKSTLTFTTVENVPVGQFIGQLTVTDADEVNNANSQFTLAIASTLGSSYFAMDSTGKISVKKQFSYEVFPTFTLYVTAVDGGSPKLTSTATVVIKVTNVDETIKVISFNTTSFISREFPHDAASGDVVCTLTTADFGLDTSVTRKNEFTSVGTNVFNISKTTGVMTVNLKDKILENARYTQWVVLTTTTSAGTESRVGVVRLDTFNKDKHLVAVVVSETEATLETKRANLTTQLQQAFVSPNAIKIWDIQTPTTAATRRRLLATESVALAVVLADSSIDDIANVDKSKTFLTQTAALKQLQKSADGTPASAATGTIPVSKVLPYTDNVTDSSLSTSMIILIVFACLAALVLIAVIVGVLVYCCYCRRKRDEDRKQLGPTSTSTTKLIRDVHSAESIRDPLMHVKHPYTSTEVMSSTYFTHNDSSYVRRNMDSSSNYYNDSLIRSDANLRDRLQDMDTDLDGAPSRVATATYISSTLSPIVPPEEPEVKPSEKLHKLEEIPEVEHEEKGNSKEVDRLSKVEEISEVDLDDKENTNSGTPKCSQTIHFINVTENTLPITPLYDLNCTDPDGGNISYSFSLTSYRDTAGYFNIDPSTGELWVTQKLDAELQVNGSYSTPYILIVDVDDGNANVTDVTVVVSVLSVDDNPPSITDLSPYRTDVPEDTPLGTVVARCGVTDLDLPGSGDEVTYVRIVGGNDEQKFTIDSQKCEVILIDELDYENNKSYTLRLEAYNPDTDNKTTLDVTINISDVNDNSPVCNMHTIASSFLESEPPGKPLAKLSCTDNDSTGNSLTYTIATANSSLNITSTGEVTLNIQQDYEQTRNIPATIKVTDSGSPARTTTVSAIFFILDVDDNIPVFKANLSTSLVVVSAQMDYTSSASVNCTVEAYSSDQTTNTSTAPLTINLIDVNDGPPVFNMSLYEGSVRENATKPTTVLRVETNEPVTFYMNYGHYFRIDPNSGDVSVNGKLDYETDTSYLLEVNAVDKQDPTMTSTAYVYISVLPSNEFTPTCQTNMIAYISESSIPGTFVTRVSASDGDDGNDGHVLYSLLNITEPFLIDRVTGNLTTGIGLDAEVRNYYTVIVLAEDQSDTTKLTGSCTVTINVKDENDNQPVCDPIAPFLITPSTDVTNFLWKFSCTDRDVSANGLQYTLVSGDTYNLFEVDSAQQSVRLKSSGPFQVGDYTLVFSVSDGQTPARTTTIAVEVKISQTLVFTGLSKVVQVYENTNVSDIIMTASASGTYELISYSILSGNELLFFNIHQTQGTIRLVKSLDRETTYTSYTLVLKASTASGLVTSGTVTVSVLDCNDNAPKFGNSYYNYAIFEGTAGLATSYPITATDPDSGNNATIDYSILSGNTGNVFKYNSNTGILSLASVLDYETTQSYTLVLCATDRGTPNKLSSTTLVFITVKDVSEQNPILISPGGTVNITLPEDTAAGANVFNITASDKDFGTQLTYYITSQSNTDQFSVNERLGGIYLNYPMDRESYQSLTLVVKVNNTNNQTNTTTIGITVSDVNDNDPVFSPAIYAVNTKHGTASGASIVTLTVTDTDNGANSTLTLNITSGNINNAFKFVGKVLTSNILLDANTNSLYILEVMAADHGTPPRYSTALVTVTIDPEFKQPLFNPTSASISVLETTTAGDLIYNMDATANGAKEHAGGDLLYSIKSGNSQNKFYIEPLGGELQLIEPLSYANTSSYTLVVLAQNILNNSLTSTFNLTITVTQVNLYDPVFSQTIYSWSVNETAKTGTIVGQVTATDKDVGQFGKLTYSIESGAPFTISSTTGVISLTGSLEYSTAKSYNFYVKAVDNAGASSRSSTSVVVISVTDFNNNSPIFTSSVYNVAVPETFPLAETFFYVLATDLDSGTFGEVTYAIATNSFGIFQIAKSTGELSLNKSLDYESNRTHVIIVTASDGSNTASATVTVTVKDENDNTPNLGFTRVDLEIFSNIVVGTLLYDVNATDRDVGVNGALNYIIQSGNDDGLFNVDISNGKVKTTKPLEYSKSFYTLVIAAIDQGIPPLNGTATIGITVNPVSQAPSGDYSFSVKENQPIGTVVDTIPPEKDWTGDTFTIVSGNYDRTFTLTITGVLITNKVLDREKYAYYVLEVSVERYDGTYVTKKVVVKVVDVNDNYPTFGQSILTFTTVENVPVGQFIGQLTVTDIDELNNPNSQFDLAIANQQGSTYFDLDQTGTITVKRKFSYEVFPSFSLYVTATDRGDPQLTSTATVIIKVTDVNETIILTAFNTTSFISREFPHDAAAGDVVCTLTTADFGLDTSVTRKNEFTSVGTNVFNINSETGAVTVNLQDRIFENARYFQWVILKTTTVNGTVSHVGLVRLDTFNKDKHLVAVLVNQDLATIQRDDLVHQLQSSLPSPQTVKLWDIQVPTPAATRRRLLAAESAALVVVLADGSADNISNVDNAKPFLAQQEAVKLLQSAVSGTVSEVMPYVSEVKDDSGLSTPIIILIVLACITALAIISLVVWVLIYCYGIRRKRNQDSKTLVKKKKKERKTPKYFSAAPPLATTKPKHKKEEKKVTVTTAVTSTTYSTPSEGNDRPNAESHYSNYHNYETIEKRHEADPDQDGAPTPMKTATYISSTLIPILHLEPKELTESKDKENSSKVDIVLKVEEYSEIKDGDLEMVSQV